MEAVLFQIVRALATVFEITLAFALLNAMFEPKYASKWPLRLSYIPVSYTHLTLPTKA